MNLIFGAAGSRELLQAFGRAGNHIVARYGQAGGIRQPATRTASCGYLRDSGNILGQADAPGLSLLLLGGIHKPLQGWASGSPLDDPDATAAFLLDRYRAEGLSFLDGVQGQYAVVVSDDNTGRLLLACDPGGMRTFYVRRSADQLIFSTSLTTAAMLLPDGPRVDRSLEDFFLIYGFYPFNHTPYQEIESMPAGTILEWTGSGCRSHPISGGNPWSGQRDISACTTEREVIDALYDAFMAALDDQAASTDRAAVLLGGVDSALVAAGLKRLGKQVETFSFEYQDSGYNQPHTDTVANHLGIRHNWIPISHTTIGDGLESFCNDFNAPTNWPNYVIQTRAVCDEIRRRGYDYCYSGDGCDTVFLGYPGTHRRTRLMSALPALPAWTVSALLRLTAIRAFERRSGHPYRVLLNLIRSLGRDMPERCHVTLRIFDEISLQQLRRGEPPGQAMTTADILHRLAEPVADMTPERLGYHGKSLISPNRNKIIGASDSCGMAINSPYLHNGFKAMAAGLPDSLSRPQQKTEAAVTGKYILLRMAEDRQLLPREAIYQKKVAAVTAPIDEWYMGPLKQRILAILEDLPFEADRRYLESLFSDKLLERIYRQHLSPSGVTSDGISLLATYASYCGLSM
jgi:hypothetical protein